MAERQYSPVTLKDRHTSSFTFNTIETLIEFLETEQKTWQEANAEVSMLPGGRGGRFTQVPGPLGQFCSAAYNLKRHLEDPSTNENEYRNSQNTFGNLQNQYFSQSNISQQNSWIASNTPAYLAWKNAVVMGQLEGDAFFKFLCEGGIETPSNGKHLTGALLAYEFMMLDESRILKRREAEQQSFENLRISLSEKKNLLTDSIDSTQKDYSAWRDQSSTDFISWKQQRDAEITNQLGAHSNEFNHFMTQSQGYLKSLEDLYHEKLRIEGPAGHWAKKATELQTQGRIFGSILLILTIASTTLVSIFFYQWIIHGIQLPLEIKSLQGALLFASLVSLIAFALKTFSRLTFSSFHLQRDAEERAQLSTVFLSIAREAGHIDDESRRIVYQALFSRTETGLLAKEHGPTMPSLVEFMNKGAKP